jgi:hypothetical protein
MKQEDVNKLLQVRKLIDSYRETRGLIFDYKEAISSEESISIDVRDNINDEILSLNKELLKLGFNSLEEFKKFNEDMCIQLISEERTVYGECDLCKGYDGIPPCYVQMGDSSCFKTHSKMNPNDIYKKMYIGVLKGIVTITNKDKAVLENGYYKVESEGFVNDRSITVTRYINYDKKILYMTCPPGHGYYNKYEKDESEFLFDLTWRI